MKKIEMKHFASNPKWLDARMFKPDCGSFDIYNTLVYDGNAIVNGRSEWIPTDHYKDGSWGKSCRSNGNLFGECIVLYFKQYDKPDMMFPSCTPDRKESIKTL